MATRKENLEFQGSQGVPLAAILDMPHEEAFSTPRAYGLFAHCFTCTKDFLAPARVGRALAERGIAVLRFDFTGLGNSCGEFAETSFSTNIEDVQAAAEFLEEHYEAPRLLMGHSLGGAAALAAASRISEVRAVATIAAPSRPGGLRRLVEPVVDEIVRDGVAEVMVAGRPFMIGRQFLDDMDAFTVESIAQDIDAALLVLHSPADTTVDISAAFEIFEAARHPKSFVSLDNADHLLSRREDAAYVAGLIDAWSDRYL